MGRAFDQEVARLDAALAGIARQDVPRGVASALNKTGGVVKTRTIRGVAKKERIQQKLIRRQVYVKRATAKRQVATVRAYTRGINMIHLKPRDSGRGGWSKRRGKGVRARGGHHFPEAFIAKGKNGKPQVFERTGKITRRQKTAAGFRRHGAGAAGGGAKYHHVDVIRLPIRRAIESIAPVAAAREMKSNFEKRLAHEIDWRLKKRGLR